MAPDLSGPVISMPITSSALDQVGQELKWQRQVGRRRIFIQTELGDVLGLEVDRAEKAGSLKKKLQTVLNIPTEQSALVCGDLVLVKELTEVRRDAPVLLTRGGLSRSQSSPCLTPPSARSFLKQDQGKVIEVVGGVSCAGKLKKVLREAVKAIESGVAPVRTTGGLGGAYLLQNTRGDSLAILKPGDEEPLAPNNPNGFVGRSLGQPGLKKAIRVGEAAVREVAAYLLDHGGFANVPETVLVKCMHSCFHLNSPRSLGPGKAPLPVTKLGSFQEYKEHDFDCSEHGTSRFPASEVHRIGILDVRLLNLDRHSGNILVRKLGKKELEARLSGMGREATVDAGVELIPIDHGYCLPEMLEAAYFEWLHWPQASLPFSEEHLAYIAALDPARDVELLRRELPMLREACLRILHLSTLFLKRAAAMGLTLAEIGAMMSRECAGLEEEASDFELVCQAAKQRLEEDLASLRLEDLASDQFSSEGLDDFRDEELSSVQFDMDEDDTWHSSLSPRSVSGGQLSPLASSRGTFAYSPASPSAGGSRASSTSPFSGGFANATPPPFPGVRSSQSPPQRSAGVTPPASRKVGFNAPLLRLEEMEPLRETSPPVASSVCYSAMGLGSSIFNRKGGHAFGRSSSSRNPHGLKSTAVRRETVLNIQGGAISSPYAAHEVVDHPGAERPLDLSDIPSRAWPTFLQYFCELIDDSLDQRRRESNSRMARLGTSCKF